MLTTYTPQELEAEAQARADYEARAEARARMQQQQAARLKYRPADMQGVLFQDQETLFTGPSTERSPTR